MDCETLYWSCRNLSCVLGTSVLPGPRSGRAAEMEGTSVPTHRTDETPSQRGGDFTRTAVEDCWRV